MWLIGAALAALPGVAHSSPPVVEVETVKSDVDCSGIAAWGPWVLIECGEQFPQMRTGLQSALLESGRVQLATAKDARAAAAAPLVVSASVSGLGMETSRASGADYCIAGTRVRGTMDYRVRRGRGGPVIHGGTVTKSVEVASHAVAGSNDCSTFAPSQTDYRQLQGELALATAREIIFKVEPLKVLALSGSRVVLNYGAPFIKMGSAVDVEDEWGVPVRFRVTNAGEGRSLAQPVGDTRPVAVSARARLIENDDPAANGRRFERVELP